jgi:hypothetical protein
MIVDSVERFDAEAADRTSRGDFLAFLQTQRENPTVKMSYKDMYNHLMDNL